MRYIEMPLKFTLLPVGGIPMYSPWWVAWALQWATTLSLSAMRSSMVLSKSGKPRRTLAASCLASSTRSGAKSSAAASRLPVWFQSSPFLAPGALERFASQVVHMASCPPMNPYSEDLRKKIVEALSRGTTKSEAARSFGVSRSSVKRYAKLAEEGRPLAPRNDPAPNPRWTRKPGGFWRQIWKSVPRPPSPSAASTWGGWPVCGSVNPP